MSDIILPHGEQKDGSIVDLYGNVLSLDERLAIIEQVEGLPATGMKDDIVHAVQNNTVVIIDGETGSGKTTQIGKMLYDPRKQITITQPRVLSAMSNSDRVSKELMADTGNPYYSLGHGVGYRTGRGVSSSRISPLSFNTDGLELMRMAYSGLVPDVLVLDEVHNFAIPTEILAVLMKYRTDVKIIIMSATLDPAIFQEYFSHISSDIPVIKIPGRTHPVTKYFNPGENYIESIATQYKEGKNILFFVPGKREIEDNIALIRAKLGPDAEIFPLHADLPKEEQQKLLIKATNVIDNNSGGIIQTHLVKPANSKPRIIVATNVAEESITIPYIDMVMDLGTHKVARYNNLGIQELRLENTAQANCLQRAGRAGRTHPGVYVRANDTSFEELPKYPEAPIEREMLDKYILILLANNIDIVKLYEEEALNDRQLFFHGFNKKLLDISYYRLTQIGAIDQAKNITPLGRDLLKFPLDIYHARMLRESIKRMCVEDMIYMTAILEKKGFVSKDEKWKEIKMNGGKESDLFGYTELFKLVTATTLPQGKTELLFSLGIDRDQLNDFIDRGGEYKLYELVDLSPIGIKNKNIKEIDELVTTLRKRLTDSGVEITSSTNVNDKKVCLATGSLHSIYKFDSKMNMFQDRSAKTRKNTLFFKAGNVTLVEPTTSHSYLGQPFIIGGDEFTQDLNLLTFLTQVDEGHIQDAKASTRSFVAPFHASSTTEQKGRKPKSVHEMNKKELHALASDLVAPFERGTTTGTSVGGSMSTSPADTISTEDAAYERIFKEEDVKMDGEQIMREFARLIEKSSKGESHNNFFQTQEDARLYYLRYRLPDFLVEHNQRISNYLKNKTEDEIFTFKELLVRFLLDHESYRINPRNIKETERRFRHDSIILDRFLESNDPFIQAFRRGEKITLPSQEVELIVGTILDEDLMSNKELFELRKQYVKLLGSVRSDLKDVNEVRIKEEVLREHFQHMELYSGEYKTIKAIYQDIGKMEGADVKKIMDSLKGVERKTKVLGKKKHKRDELMNVVENMRLLAKGAGSVDLDLLFAHKFGEDVSERYIEKYYSTIRMVSSKDKRRRQRGLLPLENIIIDMDAQVLKMNNEIGLLSIETELSGTPMAATIKQNLEALCKDFYDEDYYRTMVSGGLLELTRELVRDQVTEKKGFHKILHTFFSGLKLSHSKANKELFSAIEAYKDASELVALYSETVFLEIKETDNIEKIQTRIAEFQARIAEFHEKKDVIVKKEIAFI